MDPPAPPPPPAARRFLVSGQVQGVGFRNFTRTMARRLGLVGYVRNLPDGRVEAVAGGTSLALDRMAGYLRTGPAIARVDAVHEEPAAATGLPIGFEIRR